MMMIAQVLKQVLYTFLSTLCELLNSVAALVVDIVFYSNCEDRIVLIPKSTIVTNY